jgi:hypothetical protein
MKKGLFGVSTACLFYLFILGNLHALEINSGSLILDPGLRIWGADLGIGFKGSRIFPDLDTILWFYIGGGYENVGYYLTPDGNLYDGDETEYNPETSPYYWRVGYRLDIGLAQGITWNNTIEKNGLEFFFFYRLRYDLHLHDDDAGDPQLVFQSSHKDQRGILQNSLFAGFSWNDLNSSHPHRIKSGTYAEVSVEWGPEFMLNNVFGVADFIRLNLLGKAFIPLWDLDPLHPVNILSMYLGMKFSLDYTAGSSIPLNVLNSFGGRKAMPGLGFALRGYEGYRFPAPLKAVANLELRTNLPALMVPNIIPGIIVYFDAGYYNFFEIEEQDFLFSTGAGIFLNIFDLTSITFYTHFPLSRERVTGGYWVPFAAEFDLLF